MWVTCSLADSTAMRGAASVRHSGPVRISTARSVWNASMGIVGQTKELVFQIFEFRFEFFEAGACFGVLRLESSGGFRFW